LLERIVLAVAVPAAAVLRMQIITNFVRHSTKRLCIKKYHQGIFKTTVTYKTLFIIIVM